MTTPADDLAAEEAFEALLAGRAVPGEAAGLAAFTGAVRASAARPGRPSAALAELLATGRLTDQSSPSTRTAPSAGSPPRRSRIRRRRRFAMIFPALLAKFLAAGAIAQAATGAGVVVVAFTGAGATGLLGDHVQDTISSVVVSGEAPTKDDTDAVAGEAAGTDAAVIQKPAVVTTVPVSPPADPEAAAAAWAAGPVGDEPFGAWVSRAAGDKALRAALAADDDGLGFSDLVRQHAHAKGLDDDELAKDGVDLDELGDSPTDVPSATAMATESRDAEPEAATTSRGGSGKGANSGHGNSGGNGGRGKH